MEYNPTSTEVNLETEVADLKRRVALLEAAFITLTGNRPAPELNPAPASSSAHGDPSPPNAPVEYLGGRRLLSYEERLEWAERYAAELGKTIDLTHASQLAQGTFHNGGVFANIGINVWKGSEKGIVRVYFYPSNDQVYLDKFGTAWEKLTGEKTRLLVHWTNERIEKEMAGTAKEGSPTGG